jgi:hypothetical protein
VVVLRLVMVAVAVVAAAGCGQAPAPVVGTPQVSAPPAPSSQAATPQDEQAAVLVAYRCMWEAYDRAGRAPQADPDDPRLADCADGEALRGLRQGLDSMREQGLVIEGEFALAGDVTELDLAAVPARASVRDCGDSSDWRRVRADGQAFEDTPGGRRLIVADLQRVEGRWKVTSFGVREIGTC